jgi:peroxiredoxin
MRNLGRLSLLLVGVVACTTQHSGNRSAPASATNPTPALAAAPPLLGTLEDGKSFDLRELNGKRVVLIFYRSATCGLCTQQLHSLATHQKAYRRLHARLVALTTDPPELNQRTARLLDLDFPIVSVDQATLERWGIWPHSERNPWPAAFILDEDGTVIFRHIGQSAADRASDATLIFTLRSIEQPGARNEAP